MVVRAKLLRILPSFMSTSQKSIPNFFVREQLKGFQSYPCMMYVCHPYLDIYNVSFPPVPFSFIDVTE